VALLAIALLAVALLAIGLLGRLAISLLGRLAIVGRLLRSAAVSRRRLRVPGLAVGLLLLAVGRLWLLPIGCLRLLAVGLLTVAGRRGTEGLRLVVVGRLSLRVRIRRGAPRLLRRRLGGR